MVLLDKYRVERVIGQGGMALVVAATHLTLREPVAIKLLLPEMAQNPTVVQRFLREAKAAVRLKGEHSVRVLDVGTMPDGSPFMVMELLVGIDLAEVTKERTRLPATDAVDLLLQACEALAEAHAAGIVHRDIKPSNLFITRRPDGTPLLKVLDFGISKVAFDTEVSDLTMDSIVGTPSYMSPEQLRGSPEVDARADVWSLGIVLYRLLAGARPFKADTLAALAIQAATEPTPPLPMPYPPNLDYIVYRCLEKDPLRRYQSVAELAFALAPFAGDQRGAAIIVERTRSILGWIPPVPAATAGVPPHLAPYLVPPQMMSAGPSEPTTLGSSAGAMQSPLAAPVPMKTGRGLTWAIGGGLLAGALIAVVMSVGGKSGGTTSGSPVRPTTAPETVPTTPTPPPTPTEVPAAVVTPSETPTPVDTTNTNTGSADKTVDKTDDKKSHRRPTRVSKPDKTDKTEKPDKTGDKTETAKPPVNPLDTRM
jgi:serine/threonine-protein kinase